MLRHYFTIAVRTLERQKLSAFINVLGLSIGLACFSLFLLYGVNEFSYDRFHTNRNSICRVYDWWRYTERQGSEPSGNTGTTDLSNKTITKVALPSLNNTEELS